MYIQQPRHSPFAMVFDSMNYMFKLLVVNINMFKCNVIVLKKCKYTVIHISSCERVACQTKLQEV